MMTSRFVELFMENQADSFKAGFLWRIFMRLHAKNYIGGFPDVNIPVIIQRVNNRPIFQSNIPLREIIEFSQIKLYKLNPKGGHISYFCL